jgi:hypothetical protein
VEGPKSESSTEGATPQAWNSGPNVSLVVLNSMLLKQSHEFLFESSLAMMIFLISYISHNFLLFRFTYAEGSIAVLPSKVSKA